MIGLSDSLATNRTIPIEDNAFKYEVRDLMPGATYQVQAYTIFDNRESLAYTSRNFTTSKCLFLFLKKYIIFWETYSTKFVFNLIVIFSVHRQ